VECRIFTVPFRSLADLVDKMEDNPVKTTDSALITTLLFNTGKAFTGASKEAFFGQTGVPIFPHSTSTNVCIKRSYYKDSSSLKRRIYDNAKQFQLLSTEINCSRWASALLALVYKFMEIHPRGKPPFPIPALRYVNVALAITNNSASDVYLLEEVVGKSDGIFDKYINNTSAVPLESSDPERQDIAEFLAFTQHVQMIKTTEQAFVSDYQGSYPILQCNSLLISNKQVVIPCCPIHKS
jgi:hypothetical protein